MSHFQNITSHKNNLRKNYKKWVAKQQSLNLPAIFYCFFFKLSQKSTTAYVKRTSLINFAHTKRTHNQEQHGMKGFVIPTKSFVKIGMTKIFCYNNKMFSSINKTFGCCSKIFGCSNKKLFVVPNFVAVTKHFFFVNEIPIWSTINSKYCHCG